MIENSAENELREIKSIFEENAMLSIVNDLSWAKNPKSKDPNMKLGCVSNILMYGIACLIGFISGWDIIEALNPEAEGMHSGLLYWITFEPSRYGTNYEVARHYVTDSTVLSALAYLWCYGVIPFLLLRPLLKPLMLKTALNSKKKRIISDIKNLAKKNKNAKKAIKIVDGGQAEEYLAKYDENLMRLEQFRQHYMIAEEKFTYNYICDLTGYVNRGMSIYNAISAKDKDDWHKEVLAAQREEREEQQHYQNELLRQAKQMNETLEREHQEAQAYREKEEWQRTLDRINRTKL